MCLGLPDPDPSVFCTDLDPSINKQNKGRKPWFLLFNLSLKSMVISKKNFEKSFFFVGILSARIHESLPKSALPNNCACIFFEYCTACQISWFYVLDSWCMLLENNTQVFLLRQACTRTCSILSVLRIRDVYPGSRILEPDFYPSRISDPGSKNSNKRERWKKLVVIPFYVATNFTKLEIILVFKCWKKNSGQFSKNYRTFYPKNFH